MFKRRFQTALRLWPLVLLCGLVAASAGYFYSASREKLFESTLTLQLGGSDLSELLLGQRDESNPQLAARAAATDATLITLPRVRELAAASLGPGYTADGLGGLVSVEVQAESNLIDLSARSSSPGDSVRIVNAMVNAFLQSRRAVSQEQLDRARSEVRSQLRSLTRLQRRSDSGEALQDRLRQLDLLDVVGNGGVEVVQRGRLSPDPVSPRPVRDASLALILGLLFGAAVAAYRARANNRVVEASEFEEVWALPNLGVIPESRALRKGSKKLTTGSELEAFGLVRTNLRYLHGGDVSTIAVTSAVPREGKSTVVWNLAVSAALVGSRVLIIEADMRRPVFAQRLVLQPPAGLSEVLAGLAQLDDAICTAPLVEQPGTTVDVLSSGQVPPSAVALLEGPKFAELVLRARDKYDLVLVDTPPATVVADAAIVAASVDGVVVVSRLGHLDRSDYDRLRSQLLAVPVRVMGQVVNGGAAGLQYRY